MEKLLKIPQSTAKKNFKKMEKGGKGPVS